MSWLRFFRRRRSDRDLTREIAAHLDAERAENIARGLSTEEADRLARIKFGSARRVHEDLWYQNSLTLLEGILRDLKYALRSLAHAPGFTLTVILIMALGIGANTAVFSVMNAVLLKSLPVADPQRVAYLHTNGIPYAANNSGNIETSFSWPVYDTLRHQDRALSDVMVYVPLAYTGKAAVRIGNSPEAAEGDMVSGNFFSGLGVPIARGRAFNNDDETHHSPIVVLSYNYWTRRFSRSPDVLGSIFYVKGVPLTIVGITAQGFEGTEPGDSVDFWIPLQSRPELNAWGASATTEKDLYLAHPEWWCLRMLARLAPGISEQQALAQTQAIFARAAYIGISQPHPGEKPPKISFAPAKAFPGYEEEAGTPLKMMMAMVGLVLLIALSNIVMLLVARNANRQREFSVRLSLGAGRAQLFRQLLSEGILLVALGGTLAWFFAGMGTHALARWALINSSLAPDATALCLTLAVLVLAALLFGLAPLRISLAGGTGLVLKNTLAVTNQSSNSRSARIIVAAQMALCLSLLVGAGLLVRTLRNLQNTPLGLRTQGLVVFGINPQQARTLDERIAFYQLLVSRLRALSGVESVSLAENRPGSGWSNNNGAILVDGHKPPNSDGEEGMVRENAVGSDFFHTMGVPVLAGRDFKDSDTLRAPKVVIVNETFAKRFLPEQSPVGHNITYSPFGIKNGQIIGLVKNHKYEGITESPMPMLWMPYTQFDGVAEMHVEMRVAGDPLAILPVAQNAVRQIDPNVPLLQPMLQQQQFEQSISAQILFARLAECFGLLAILLVATGLYGTLAYRVTRRTAEIGVRMALGARRGQVVWMILQGSFWLTCVGVLVGAPLAILISRTLASALYQVKPFEAATYAAAVLCLVLVSLASSAIPAQRAARLDPAKALRTE